MCEFQLIHGLHIQDLTTLPQPLTPIPCELKVGYDRSNFSLFIVLYLVDKRM